ncbi:MAG: hypothetical protein H0S79_13245 [Anaerolineaceae bacterium]|nr:hypothetical protein [Anaerolineaceae bacterium]
MKKITLTLSLIILSSLLFGCTANTTPEQPALPTATPTEVIPTDVEEPIATATSEPLPTPIPNEYGLTIEEYEIIGIIDLDSLTFKPVYGSKEAIFERHAAEKSEQYSYGTEMDVDSEGHQYRADEADDNGSVIVTVFKDDESIFQVNAGDISPISPLRRLWIEDDHWMLEIAYITTTTVDNGIYSNAVGQVYRDGVSLNEEYGYEEIFGYQLLDGKPFFFYKLDGKIHLSYDGETLPIWYDSVRHYSCCSGAMLNPRMGTNWVSFWGEREGVMYYTEIGKY